MQTNDTPKRWLATAAIALGLSLAAEAEAQDYQLMSHNLTPFRLNPAMAGNANAKRMSLDFRQQWPQLDNHFNTVRLSYDQNFYKRICSVGVSYAHDNYASSVFNTNQVDAVYSHAFEVGREGSVRLGLEVSYYFNMMDHDKMQFGDQYDKQTGKVDGATIENFDQESRTFFDFSAGAAYILTNTLSVGAAVYHIAEPENGFQEKSANTLCRRYVVHANYMHDLLQTNGLWGRRDLSDKYLYLSANYQQQDDFRQCYVGAGVYLTPVVLGLSEKTDIDEVYTTSVHLGCSYKGLQAFYVFDLFTSDKKNGSWSHEVSLVYIVQDKERFPCPMVYW